MTNADQYWPTTVANTDQWIILNNTDQYQPTLTNTDQHWPVMRSIKGDWLPADAPVSPLQLAKQGVWVPNSPQHLKIIFLPPPYHHLVTLLFSWPSKDSGSKLTSNSKDFEFSYNTSLPPVNIEIFIMSQFQISKYLWYLKNIFDMPKTVWPELPLEVDKINVD